MIYRVAQMRAFA